MLSERSRNLPQKISAPRKCYYAIEPFELRERFARTIRLFEKINLESGVFAEKILMV